MPSMLLGLPVASGPVLVISGNPWSGFPLGPYEGITFKWICGASGAIANGGSGYLCYIGLSGIQQAAFPSSGYIGVSGSAFGQSGNVMPVNSGGMAPLSGQTSGNLDGMPLRPGDSYFIPRGALMRDIANSPASGALSGNLTVFAACDPGASGIGRLYWEMDTRYGY